MITATHIRRRVPITLRLTFDTTVSKSHVKQTVIAKSIVCQSGFSRKVQKETVPL
jgi:hypothetical protein